MGAHKTIQVKSEYKIEQLAKEIINSMEPQIVIEVSEDCSLLTNEINLRLLKFYAEEEEKEIIVNTVDPVLISLAQRLGISTISDSDLDIEPEPGFFKSHCQGKAEIAAAPEDQPSGILTPKNSRPGRLLPAIVLLLFTLILSVWWFLQPKAVVLVYPKEQALPFKATAQISTAFNDADISNGKIPAKNLEQQCKAVTQSETTGHKIIGITSAVGKVIVINSSNQPILLPKSCVFYGRDGIRFLTDKDVLVPKKSTKLESGIIVGENYGKVEISVTAEKKGTSGNQPAKAITNIDEKYQNFLKVANPAPTRNGTDKRVAIVTLEDVKKGETEVKRQMQMAINDDARSLVNKDYLFLTDLVKAEVIHITNKPEIGSEGDSVQTELEYRITVLVPTAVGIQKFLNSQFDRNIPNNFEAKNHKIDLVSMRVLTVDEELAGLELLGQGEIRGVLDQHKIKDLIKGKSITAAKEILDRQNEIADVKLKVDNPGSKLPSFGFQIKVLFPAGSKVNLRL